MKKLHLTAFLINCIWFLPLVIGQKPYCFQYRWFGDTFASKKGSNCTELKGAPCIDPLLLTEPNTTEIWIQKDTSKMCELTPGNVCIKYTFTYNNAIVNASSYCGKMIEDMTSAITSGCYHQNLDGYTIEACACESKIGMEPCNKSIKVESCKLIMIIALSIALINFMNP